MSLRGYAGRRLAVGLLQVLGVATLVFVLTAALPGDAAVVVAGDSPDPERIEHLRRSMGLDRPVPIRFLDWLGGAMRGDLGASLVSGRPVLATIVGGFSTTGVLALVTVIVLVPLGVGLGVLAGARPGSATDRGISAATIASYSVPEFASAVLLVTLFAVWLRLVPANTLGLEGPLLSHPEVLLLPVLVLLIRPVCSIARLTRAGVADGLTSDYASHARRRC